METQEKDLEVKEEKLKSRNKKFVTVAFLVFLAYLFHLYLATGSFNFITNIFKGDFVQITSMVLTLFVIIGWVIIYRLFKKL